MDPATARQLRSLQNDLAAGHAPGVLAQSVVGVTFKDVVVPNPAPGPLVRAALEAEFAAHMLSGLARLAVVAGGVDGE